jgi:hypothetical protein
MEGINYLAVLVAGASSMVVGGIWYANGVFGKKWQAAAGLSDEQIKSGAVKAMGLTLLLSVLMALVLSVMMDYMGAATWLDGLLAALVVWGGFVFTTHTSNALFNQKTGTLLWLYLGNQLITLLLMGAILGAWQ